jgi:iron complex outermembrane recepter protein
VQMQSMCDQTRAFSIRLRWTCAAALIILLAANIAAAQNTLPPDLTQFTLEDLMNVQVTSVSKKEQKLFRTGAAAYVITQEDIRRSGMTNIPDLLRMVPGVNVARITANSWAISIRGFNDQYATKVLVLIDGRSIYTQQFSGVFWDSLSVPLEDIDRIEVIRGPGGTVWGANAVNGVINIITKHSSQTEGGLATVGAGSEERARGVLRYGGKAGRAGSYRVFGNYFNIDEAAGTGGRPAQDAWYGLQGGFRSDWTLSSSDTLTVEGDLYQARKGQTLTTLLPKESYRIATFEDRIKSQSGNLLGRWNHTYSNGSETSLQVYYTHGFRSDQGLADEDIADVDFQYRLQRGSRHDLVSGIGYRRSRVDMQPLYTFQFDERRLSTNLFNTFLQDEISLSKTVSLTIGSKFEHNSFTGFEFEPSAQLVWAPNDRRMLWASAARAIRQPSWLYSNARADVATTPLEGGAMGLVHLRGTSDTQAEQVYDYEAGYRAQVHKRLSFDLTGFRSHYRRLTTVEPETPFPTMSLLPPQLIIPRVYANRARSRNYGAEVFATWQVSNRWRITPGYTFLQMKVVRDPSSNDDGIEGISTDSPKHQFHLRSLVNLRRNVEWDSFISYVSPLSSEVGLVQLPVPNYTRLDTRLGWRLGEYVELSVAGQNLLAPRHLEFSKSYNVSPTEVQRSISGKVTWRF